MTQEELVAEIGKMLTPYLSTLYPECNEHGIGKRALTLAQDLVAKFGLVQAEAIPRAVLKSHGLTDTEVDELLVGCKKGIEAMKAGKVQPWSEVKKELGII